MDCMKAQEYVDPFTEGTIPDSAVLDYLKHVKKCPDCRNDLEISFLLNRSLETMDNETGGYDFDQSMTAYIAKKEKRARFLKMIRILLITTAAIVGVRGIAYLILGI